MAFPTSVDDLSTAIPVGGAGHTQHHRDLATAVEAIETYVLGGVRAAKITLTPSNLTDSVTLPAGAVLVEPPRIIPVTTWDGGALLDIGDGDDPDGWMAGFDCVTSADPYLSRNIPADWNATLASYAANAGSAPAYAAADGYYSFKAHYPAGGTITASVTATAPTVGETTIVVLVTVPA